MNDKNIEEILKEVAAENIPADVHKIAEEVSKDFSKTLSQSEQPKHYVLGDYIMKSRLTKLAVAAAVIIVVVLVGLPFVGNKGSTIALADVLEKVEQVQAFMYKMKMTITGAVMPGMPAGKIESEGTIIISNRYGMKMDMDISMINDVNNHRQEWTQQIYIHPDRKIMLLIIPEQKMCRQTEHEGMPTELKSWCKDPREMIKQFMNHQYTELGRSEIDGIEVEGFRTTDVNYVLWVDVKNWLPVRMEMNGKAGDKMQMSMVAYDYQWYISVDANEFEPVIPKDYSSMPSWIEDAAIDGLRFCGQLLNRYPKKIDMTNIMNEIMAIKDSNSPTEVALKVKELALKLKEQSEDVVLKRMNNVPVEETAKKIVEITKPAHMLITFYTTLVQEKTDPAYYGESVTVGDANAVLMRWKIWDNQYRVIFGDLTAENVTAEKLAELEAALPK